jgi:predicted GTPase
MPERVVIMGAAGRDFHNFNVVFRDDPEVRVEAFTATQIPNIDGRRYPAPLAGSMYADGIPIVPETELVELVERVAIDQVVFSYSDVSHIHVMHAASSAMAAGADFRLLGPRSTMLQARCPVIAVCATRTGAGKSPTTARVASILEERGIRPVVVRHPMPYGDLVQQAVQRFASQSDLDAADLTIEEREEYERHIDAGRVLYAGVDYGQILKQAEAEADVILWDGGNNDFPFYRPDCMIVVVDPHRADHGLEYHPGETCLRMADVVVINKVETATIEQLATARTVVDTTNPGVVTVEAASPITVEEPGRIRGRRVLVVEDGPTLTHGGMAFGAGWIAARRFGAAEIVDPRDSCIGSVRAAILSNPHLGPVVPAIGYGAEQVKDLEQSLRIADADLVLVATPVDLSRILNVEKPMLRVTYGLQEVGSPTLEEAMLPYLGAVMA